MDYEPVAALALDPGRTTGYAFAWKDEDSFLVAYGQQLMTHGELWRFIPPLIDHVICESFEFRHGKQLGVDLYPCELIGVVRLWVEGPTFREQDLVELHMQTAGQGKSYFGDEKLKSMLLYRRGVQHGRDACRHLLQWFYFGSGYQYIGTTDKPELIEVDEILKKIRG